MTTLRLLSQRPIGQDDAYADLRYDYSRIENEEDREAVRNAALEIKPRLKRAAEDLFGIGQALLSTKDRLPHGQWGEWVTVEFGLSERTARNWVLVARRLGAKSAKFAVLPPSALYELAAPSTDSTVLEQVEAQIDAGEAISHADVISLKQQQKEEMAARQAAVEAEIKAWLERRSLTLADQIELLQAIKDKAPHNASADLFAAVEAAVPLQQDEGLPAANHLLAVLKRQQISPAVSDTAIHTLRQALHEALQLLDQEEAQSTYRQVTGSAGHLRTAVLSLKEALLALGDTPER